MSNDLIKKRRYKLSPQNNVCWYSHKIADTYVLPADAYMEIIAIALYEWYGISNLSLQDVHFAQAVQVEDERDTSLLELIAKAKGNIVEILLQELNNGDTRLLFSAIANLNPLNIDSESFSSPFSAVNHVGQNFIEQELYDTSSAHYLGELYHTIKNLTLDKKNAYAKLRPSNMAAAMQGQFLTSPPLLNAIFITAIKFCNSLSKRNKDVFVPVKIGEWISAFDLAIDDTYELFLRLVSENQNEYCFDIHIIDNHANLVVKATNLTIALRQNKTQNFQANLGLQPDEPIAVIGMAGYFPDADNIADFWSNLFAGHCAVKDISERWDLTNLYTPEPGEPGKTYSKWGALLSNIDKFGADFFQIPGIEAKQMDPQQRLFLEVCWRTLEDGGYALDKVQGKSCGIFVGASPGDYLAGIDRNERIAQSFWGNSAAAIPSRIAYHLDLRGPAVAVDTACSASLMALHLACQSIRRNECEMAIAGGAFVMTTPEFYLQTSSANMLSPSGRCRTFDADADGFVPGEAVAAVL